MRTEEHLITYANASLLGEVARSSMGNVQDGLSRLFKDITLHPVDIVLSRISPETLREYDPSFLVNFRDANVHDIVSDVHMLEIFSNSFNRNQYGVYYEGSHLFRLIDTYEMNMFRHDYHLCQAAGEVIQIGGDGRLLVNVTTSADFENVMDTRTVSQRPEDDLANNIVSALRDFNSRSRRKTPSGLRTYRTAKRKIPKGLFNLTYEQNRLEEMHQYVSSIIGGSPSIPPRLIPSSALEYRDPRPGGWMVYDEATTLTAPF